MYNITRVVKIIEGGDHLFTAYITDLSGEDYFFHNCVVSGAHNIIINIVETSVVYF